MNRIVRSVGLLVMGLAVLMFVPPLRNVLTLGTFPKRWKDLPTLQLMKANLYSYSSTTAALSPCTEPARVSSHKAGHYDPLQRLLSTEPFTEAQARSEDEEARSKALAWLNKTSQRRDRYFRYAPMLSPTDKARLLLTWRVVHEALTFHNITYFLSDASLLGVFRHGGIVPWDDDIDIAVDGTDAEKVRRVLSCIPGYTLRVQPSTHWKFFSDEAQVVDMAVEAPVRQTKVLKESEKSEHVLEYHLHEDVVMRFPFVDIFLLTGDGAYVWALANFALKWILHPVGDVYPLSRANFEGYFAPVPRRSAYLLNRMFDANLCVSPSHDHRLDHEIDDVSAVPCKELEEVYKVYTV